jgi:hypothetical protein
MASERIPAFILLIVAMVAVAMMFNRVWAPFNRRPPGQQVHDTRLTYMQKLLVHAKYVMIALGISNLFLVGRLIGSETLSNLRLTEDGLGEMFVLVGIVVAIVIPTRYVFTTEGFAIENGRLYRWDEFARYGLGPGRVRFEGKGDRPIKVDLFMNHVQQAAFRPVLKRYFGKTPVARTRARPPR